MKDTIETIIKIIVGFGVVGGFFGWLLSGLLNNKKDTVIMQIEIKNLKEKISNAERDCKERVKELQDQLHEHVRVNKNGRNDY